MRLIDADELIEMIEGSEELLDFQKDECIQCVNACDTAHDVEKVVAELRNTGFCNKCLNNHNAVSVCAEFCDMGKRLEIVRNGGKE